MAPAAISPVSPPSPTLDDTCALAKAGAKGVALHTMPNGHPISPATLDASKLSVTRTSNPRPVPAANSPEVWAANVPTDHMLTCSWNITTGWQDPEIKPYGPLSLMPTASVLHYATECFEGLRAYRGYDGRVRLFRPERNARRFLLSATRISLPGFSPDEFIKLLERFVAIDAPKWLPEPGSFFYLRPTMIATNAALGISRPTEALMYVVGVLFPPLDEPDKAPGGNSTQIWGAGKVQSKPAAMVKGQRLLASRHDMIRAWPGGFGYAKVGANYGPSIVAQGEARDRGYNQILWLFGDECYVTEAGGSNFFVLWRKRGDEGRRGKLELVTAPLGDGIILEGVTRGSIIDIVKQKMADDVEVVERKFTMNEVVQAYREERLIEAFGSGTAVFIAPVQDIHFRGTDIELPLARGVEPKYALTIKGWLKDIMYGREQHPWGVVVEEEE